VPLEPIFTLIAIAVALLGSPGPAPLALAATGAVFGFRAGVPFLAGILLGLGVALILTFFGLASVLAAYPGVQKILAVIGGLYICFIAYKIASAPIGNSTGVSTGDIPTFSDGFILNLINPKVYAAFLAIFSQFLLPVSNTLVSYVSSGLIVFMVAVAVDVAWLGLGGMLAPIFSRPRSARILRVMFALTMIGTIVWVLA